MEIDIAQTITSRFVKVVPPDWDKTATQALTLWQEMVYEKERNDRRLISQLALQSAVADCQKAVKTNQEACLLFIKICEKLYTLSSQQQTPIYTFQLAVLEWVAKPSARTDYAKSMSVYKTEVKTLDELDIPHRHKRDYMNFCKRNPSGTVAQWFSYVNAATHRRKLCKDLAESGAITSKYFGKRMFDQAKQELSLLPEQERSQWCLESTETGQGEEIIENTGKV